jgi:hypothetical protein
MAEIKRNLLDREGQTLYDFLMALEDRVAKIPPYECAIQLVNVHNRLSRRANDGVWGAEQLRAETAEKAFEAYKRYEAESEEKGKEFLDTIEGTCSGFHLLVQGKIQTR